MPKKAYLAQHCSADELKNNYRTCTEPVEARRWHLLWKISLGWTIKNAANSFRCCGAVRCRIKLSV